MEGTLTKYQTWWKEIPLKPYPGELFGLGPPLGSFTLRLWVCRKVEQGLSVRSWEKRPKHQHASVSRFKRDSYFFLILLHHLCFLLRVSEPVEAKVLSRSKKICLELDTDLSSWFGWSSSAQPPPAASWQINKRPRHARRMRIPHS